MMFDSSLLIFRRPMNGMEPRCRVLGTHELRVVIALRQKDVELRVIGLQLLRVVPVPGGNQRILKDGIPIRCDLS